MRFLKKTTTIDFLSLSRRRVALSISAILIIASLVSLGMRGMNFGIDFTGGILLELGYTQDADIEGIRNELFAAGFEDAQVQLFGAANDVLVRLPPQEGSDQSAIREQLQATLTAGGKEVDLRRVEAVSPQVGSELAEQGGLAMIIALLLIFAYVMFRFQWKFAAGAVAALVHDVIITIGFFSVFGLPFDLTVVAAVLAVIGYSLNDTVVAFDRIRENFFKLRGVSAEESMNTSINEMLARTIITGLTTLLVLFALLTLGGESIAPFSIALIVGIIIGTYSSIYTASATALLLGVNAQDLIEPVKDPERAMRERNAHPACYSRAQARSYRSGEDGFDLGGAELGEARIDLRRAGEDVAGFEVILTAVEAADDAARLANDQAARCKVPGRQACFPEAVESAGGDVTKIESGGAGAPYAGRVLKYLAEHREVGLHLVVGMAEREAGADQRALEIVLPADTDATAVKLGAGSTRRREEFLVNRVVNHAVLHAATDLHADGYREYREAVQEVRGAVERVDDPDGVRVAARAGFLGEDGVIRIMFVYGLDDFPFGGTIRLADVIVAALHLDLQAVELDEVSHQGVAGAPRGHHGHIQ
jgi:preprotein translocase subunit SecF